MNNNIEAVISTLLAHDSTSYNLDGNKKSSNPLTIAFKENFKKWAGANIDEFTTYMRPHYYQYLLRDKSIDLFSIVDEKETDTEKIIAKQYIKIIPLTSDEMKNNAEHLQICYSIQESHYGEIIVASTELGICHLGYVEKEKDPLSYLKKYFSEATMVEKETPLHLNAASFISSEISDEITLHIMGSSFQIEVWNELLKIPFGNLSTYGRIAEKISTIKASRAVGTAIGSNPIAYIIPCHRVVRSDGEISGYLWGPNRKRAMLGIEAVRLNKNI